jgi:hypothetical protein
MAKVQCSYRDCLRRCKEGHPDDPQRLRECARRCFEDYWNCIFKEIKKDLPRAKGDRALLLRAFRSRARALK